jgi:hypothetical protein
MVYVPMFPFNYVNYVFYFYVNVFLLLYVSYYVYSVALCCSVYCLCVNVKFATATGLQPNCSKQIYHQNWPISSARTSGAPIRCMTSYWLCTDSCETMKYTYTGPVWHIAGNEHVNKEDTVANKWMLTGYTTVLSISNFTEKSLI